MYHRVASRAVDPWGLCVAEERFAAHVARLARDWHVLPLGELVTAHAERRAVPARSVAITFDDGYRDNLEVALPLLAAASLPATFFLSSAHVGAGVPFWWDTIERLCADAKVLDAGLGAAIAGSVGDSRGSLPADDPSALRALGLSPGFTRLPPVARRAYVDLWHRCHALEPSARDALLASLATCHARIAALAPDERVDAPDDAHAVLRSDALPALLADPLFDGGSHGVTHTPLAVLDVRAQRRELHESRERLAAWTGRPIELASYPNGVKPAPEVLDAPDFPYRAAFTTEPMPIRREARRHALPRVKVDDLDDAAFGRLLERHAGRGAPAGER